MAYMKVGFFSDVLGMSVTVDVILPQAAPAHAAGEVPVLWLLHGMSGSHSIWGRKSSIERYAGDLGMAVIMPNAHLSNYLNMPHSGKYFTYIADELPRIMRSFFPMLCAKRELNFIAGLSMGGYGCLKIGLSRPENFAAIGCFSGANAPAHNDGAALPPDRQAIDAEVDLSVLAKAAIASGKPCPRIYQSCGTEDFLYADNIALRDTFLSLAGDPFSYTYAERPGTHEWRLWDQDVQDFLKFTNLPAVAPR